MRAIYKYPLEITEKLQLIELPTDHTFRSILTQAGGIALYFEVGLEETKKTYGFQLVRTGWDIEAVLTSQGISYESMDETFLGSVAPKHLQFVCHIYSLGEVDISGDAPIPF